jgi:predicted metalloprotease with PDZ domain
LPQGLPRPGDQGLDGTPTWGRKYWGGALFYLLADLEIRERTGDRRSLDDALRGVLAAGGDVSRRWEIGQLLDAADRATGLTVLRDLHAKMGSAPVAVDLAALWKRLGIERRNTAIVLDEKAPLSAIRRSMTRRTVQKVLGDSSTPPRR